MQTCSLHVELQMSFQRLTVLSDTFDPNAVDGWAMHAIDIVA